MIYNLLLKLEDRGDQQYAICPFHAENTASLAVNPETGQWYCHGCQQGGGEQYFVEKYFDVNPVVAKHIVDHEHQTGTLLLPNPADVHRYQKSWEKRTEVQEEMARWGWTNPEVLEELEIGWDTNYKRIVFPIRSNGVGHPVVNLRKYLPKHLRSSRGGGSGRTQAKCLNLKGLGQNRYWPQSAFNQPADLPIYIVEGEKDCVAARCQGLNAVTALAGGTIPLGELKAFRGRQVILMLDNDEVGIRGTHAYIQGFQALPEDKRPESVQIIEIPGEKGKDYADWYFVCQRAPSLPQPEEIATFLSRHEIVSTEALSTHNGGEKGSSDLTSSPQAFQEATVALSESESNTLDAFTDEEIPTLTVVQSEYTQYINKWIRLENMSVTGTESGVYTIPRCLGAQCLGGSCKNACPLADGAKHIIPVPVRQFLAFIRANDGAQTAFIKSLFGCRNIQVTKEDKDDINIQHFTFQEGASFLDGLEKSSFENRAAVYVYDNVRLNATAKYHFEACRCTDPGSQKNFYVVRKATPTSGFDAATFGVNETNVFQYFQEQASAAPDFLTLLSNYYDMWLPKLAIEDRLDLFGALLLTYTSVTEIKWAGDILKGWLDIMVIGDTRTGKSQMAQRFVKALEMGAYINGENARKTGIVGGVVQVNKMWLISWGAIPLNDKGLLIIDEASGLTVDDIKELSSTRSSGAVTINKVVKGEARARTRLIWMSNPRSGQTIAEYFYLGWGAFQEFIPSTEDQARYDMVIVAARDDVDILTGNDPGEFTVDIQHWQYLISTAWQIESEHIDFTQEFKRELKPMIKELNDKYKGGPLVIGVSLYEKLLRISCAVAVLCGSFERRAGEEGMYGQAPLYLVVNGKHLKWAVEFFEYTLQKESLNYKNYIKDIRAAGEQKSENIKYVRGIISMYPALRNLLGTSTIRSGQLQELLNMNKGEAATILSNLIAKGLLRIHQNGYYGPTKNLIQIIKQMEVN